MLQVGITHHHATPAVMLLSFDVSSLKNSEADHCRNVGV